MDSESLEAYLNPLKSLYKPYSVSFYWTTTIFAQALLSDNAMKILKILNNFVSIICTKLIELLYPNLYFAILRYIIT